MRHKLDSEASSLSSASDSASEDERHPADELIINKAVRRSEAAARRLSPEVLRSPPGLSRRSAAAQEAQHLQQPQQASVSQAGAQLWDSHPDKPPGLSAAPAAPAQNGKRQLSWQRLAFGSVVGSTQLLQQLNGSEPGSDSAIAAKAAATRSSSAKGTKATSPGKAAKKRRRNEQGGEQPGSVSEAADEKQSGKKQKRAKNSPAAPPRQPFIIPSGSSDIDAVSMEVSDSDDEQQRRLDAETTLAVVKAAEDDAGPIGVTVIPDDADVVDNAAMQKLLRAPRYFDLDFEDSSFKCFKCGKSGHMARDCPNAERQRPCFLCANFGHSRQNCPNRISGVICFKCNRAGHLARDCPAAAGSGPQLQRICQRCGFADCEAAAEGDVYRAEGGCSRRYADTDLALCRCYVCGAKGHLCCQPSPATTLKPTCYNCGEGGHAADECLKEAPPAVEAERRGRPNDRRAAAAESRHVATMVAKRIVTAPDYRTPGSYGHYGGYTDTRETWTTPRQNYQRAAYTSYSAQVAYPVASSYAKRVVAMQAHTAGGRVYPEQYAAHSYDDGSAAYGAPPQYGTSAGRSGSNGYHRHTSQQQYGRQPSQRR